MTRTFKATAIAAALVTLTAPAYAAGGATPLSNCYNRVISVCNQGSHLVSCSENAMNACDKQHSAQVAPSLQKLLRAKASRAAKIQFEFQMATSKMNQAEQ